MSRYQLMPPNTQDAVFWKEFCDAIDYVWASEIDNPQKAFQLLRDTYALTYSGYGQPKKNSYPKNEYDTAEGTKVFDINNFFDFSRRPEQADFTVVADTQVIDLAFYGATNVQTGYPLNLIIIYYLLGDDYIQIPPAQFRVISPTQIEFNYVIAAGTTIKIVERISSAELSSQLRYLGFQFPDTEFINRASSYIASPALQVLASNFSNYLATTKGTRQFMDFYGFCLASEFEVVQLWTEKTELETKVSYWNNPAPYLYFYEKKFTTTLVTAQTSITLVDPYTITGLAVPTSTIDVYYKQPGETAKLLPAFYYYSIDQTTNLVTLNTSFKNPITGTNNLVAGTEIVVEYKRPKINYGALYTAGAAEIGNPVWQSGPWFPTSHVDLRYNLVKYGGSVNFNEIRKFFEYIANLNLVLRDVVLYETLSLPGLSVGGALQMKITQL